MTNIIRADGQYVWRGGERYRVVIQKGGSEVSQVKDRKAVAKEVAKILIDAKISGDLSTIKLRNNGISSITEVPQAYQRRFQFIVDQIQGYNPVERTATKLDKLLSSPESDRFGVLKSDKTVKSLSKKSIKNVAQSANKSKIAEDAGKYMRKLPLTPYGYDGSGMKQGRVIPTSMRKLSDDDDHLMNAYATKLVSKGSILLRSGVIDTEQKKKEFLHVATQEKNRVLSLSLTGVMEGAMMDKQHKLLAGTHISGDSKYEVVHLLTPANRNALYTQQYLQTIPGGNWFDKMFLRGGEAYAHKQNLEGIAQLYYWMKNEEPSDDFKNLMNALQNGDQKNLKKYRKRLRNTLKEFVPAADKKEERLFKMILTEQLLKPGRKKISRGQESLMILLLARELGVNIGINCKSGLDRTGWLHAAFLALPDDFDEAYDLLINWDNQTTELNQLVAVMADAKMAQGKGKAEAYAESFAEISNDFPKYQRINEYRERVLEHLLSEGLPITAISTGLMGLKWHKGKSENLIPLNFIPPVVKENDRSVMLVAYSTTTGEVKGLTKKGHRRITQMSPFRKG